MSTFLKPGAADHLHVLYNKLNSILGSSLMITRCNVHAKIVNLFAAAAVIIAGVSTDKVMALTWACGSTGQLTCHDLPCAIGDSSSTDTNTGTTHCVSRKVEKLQGDTGKKPQVDSVKNPASTLPNNTK